jgi:molybdenum cofactor cytidylyltransferase
MVSGIVLAAGAARRFGSPKPLALWEGKTLLRHVVDAIDVDELTDLIVVTPPDERYAIALRGTRARCVANPTPDAGQGSSLRLGVASLPAGTQAVLIALGDQPTIRGETVRTLVHAWRAGGAAVVAPSYRGTRGHPVLMDASVFGELRAVTGDVGGRFVIQRHESELRIVAIDLPPPPDIDTPADLALLRDDASVGG